MPNPNLLAASLTAPKQAAFYHGAQWDRLNADWVYGRVSADVTLRYDAQVLRNRAREMVANNSTASAIPHAFAENIVGKDGIILQPMIENSRGKMNDRLNEQIAEKWEQWGKKGQCTTDGGLSWVECQNLYATSLVTDGEVLTHLVRGYPGNDFAFAIDFVDPDQLDHYMNTTPAPGVNMVRMGVEVDPWFKPVAYHFWINHPSEPMPKKRIRVPASEVLHGFDRFRGRQTRGVTHFAPVLMDVKMLGGYREGELVASRTAANKQGFIEHAEGISPALPDPGDPSEQIQLQAEPGVIEQLAPGQHFVGWDPQHPGKNYDMFDKAIIRSIAAGLRLSYMTLSGDLHGTTYGSGRIGLLSERAVFQGMQQRQVSNFNDPVYEAWLQFAVLTGEITLPAGMTAREAARYRRWHARNFPWLDPKNDMEAAEREVAMGIDTVTRIAAERGRDIEDVFKERKAEMELAEEYGVPLVLDKGVPIGGPSFDTTDEGADQPADETAHPGPGTPGDPESDVADTGPSQNGNGKKPSGNGKKPVARMTR